MVAGIGFKRCSPPRSSSIALALPPAHNSNQLSSTLAWPWLQERSITISRETCKIVERFLWRDITTPKRKLHPRVHRHIIIQHLPHTNDQGYGRGVPFGAAFCNGYGSPSRATSDSPVPVQIQDFSPFVFYRFYTDMEWLPTLRRANSLTCLFQWGTESLRRVV